MQGNWIHGAAYYRCRYPNEYAIANQLDHPNAVCLSEDTVVPELDAWLASAFNPTHIEATLRAFDPAQHHPSAGSAA